MEIPETGHESVMMGEVLEHLRPGEGKIFVDCTVGRGGHSRALAERLGNGGTLIGLDMDSRNLKFAQKRLEGVGARVRLFHANFAEVGDVMEEVGVEKVDGILADLGVSTNQLFDEAYGLSFAHEMPLDMRLDPRIGRTAADVVNTMKEEELANILYELAQERYSRRVARAIGEARRVAKITTTARLAEVVRGAIPKRKGPLEKIDPATRTFMALRMHVNDEMENVRRMVEVGPTLLKANGRMAVISFHSGEDRIVKQRFRVLGEGGVFEEVTRKPLTPTEEEMGRNPRSRSAKMRVIERAS